MLLVEQVFIILSPRTYTSPYHGATETEADTPVETARSLVGCCLVCLSLLQDVDMHRFFDQLLQSPIFRSLMGVVVDTLAMARHLPGPHLVVQALFASVLSALSIPSCRKRQARRLANFSRGEVVSDEEVVGAFPRVDAAFAALAACTDQVLFAELFSEVATLCPRAPVAVSFWMSPLAILRDELAAKKVRVAKANPSPGAAGRSFSFLPLDAFSLSVQNSWAQLPQFIRGLLNDDAAIGAVIRTVYCDSAALDRFNAYLLDPLSDAVMAVLDQDDTAEERLVEAAKRRDYDAVVSLITQATSDVPPPPTPAHRRVFTEAVYFFLEGKEIPEPEERAPTTWTAAPAAVSEVRVPVTENNRRQLVEQFQQRCRPGGGPITLASPLWTDTLRLTDLARIATERNDVQHIVVCCERVVADSFVLAPGRSVTLVAQSFEIAAATPGKVGIDVSGSPGMDGLPGGVAGLEPGCDGAAGAHGSPGHSGGHITLFAHNMESVHRKGVLVLMANGGKGGRGGDGGDGVPGKDGRDGPDATADLSARTAYHHCLAFRRGGAPTHPRGRGGDGGSAGMGGVGGSLGTVRLFGDDGWRHDFQTLDHRPVDGQDGFPGSAGQGGPAGVNGKPGLDSQVAAHCTWLGNVKSREDGGLPEKKGYVDVTDATLKKKGYLPTNEQWSLSWLLGAPEESDFLPSASDRVSREMEYRDACRGKPGVVKCIGEKTAANLILQVSPEELVEFLSLHAGTLQHFGCGWAVASASEAVLVDDSQQQSIDKENVVAAPGKLRRASVGVRERSFAPSAVAVVGTDVTFDNLEFYVQNQGALTTAQSARFTSSLLGGDGGALGMLLHGTTIASPKTKAHPSSAAVRLQKLGQNKTRQVYTPKPELLQDALVFASSLQELHEPLLRAQRLLADHAISCRGRELAERDTERAKQFCCDIKKQFPDNHVRMAVPLRHMALLFAANESAETRSGSENAHGAVLQQYLKESCDLHEALHGVATMAITPCAAHSTSTGLDARIVANDALFSHLLAMLRCSDEGAHVTTATTTCLPAVGLLLTHAAGGYLSPEVSRDLALALLTVSSSRMKALFAALTRNAGITVPPIALVDAVQELSTLSDDQTVALLNSSLDRWQFHCRGLRADRLLMSVDEPRRSVLRSLDQSRVHRGAMDLDELRHDVEDTRALDELVRRESCTIGVLETSPCTFAPPTVANGTAAEETIDQYSRRFPWLQDNEHVVTVAKWALRKAHDLEQQATTPESVRRWRSTLLAQVQYAQTSEDPTGAYGAFEKMLTSACPVTLSEIVGYAVYVMFEAVALRPHPYQVLAAVALLLLPGPSLSRIVTGGGKTLIVALVAAVRALFGFHVDIVTANSALAISGEQSMRPFFLHFFGHSKGTTSPIACGVPVEASPGRFSVDQAAYAAKVLYTTAPQLCSDMLDDENDEPPRFWKKRTARYLIADEVDVLLLDRYTEVLYRAQVIPELQHMLPLLCLIWSKVEKASSDALRCSIVDSVQRAVDDGKVWLGGDVVAEHAQVSLPTLVDSAFYAKELKVDREYVLVHSGSFVKIVPYDLCIGEELQSTTWSNGLSQFLQLKHRLRLSTQAPHAQWVSARKLVTGYNEHFCGVSGTLGTARLHGLFKSRFDIRSVVEFPPGVRSRFIRDPDTVAASKREWLDAVKGSVGEAVAAGRIVHVITESIDQSRMVEAHLGDIGVPVHRYRCNTDVLRPSGGADCSADDAVSGEFKSPCVILATNKGGRGTDIKISRDVNARGGVKVIVTEPMSGRLLTQAFGRAARQGDNGSGCLVLHTEALSILDAVNSANEAELNRVAEMVDRQQSRVEMEDRIGQAANGRWAALRSSLTWLPQQALVGPAQPRSNPTLRAELSKIRVDEVQSAFAVWLANEQTSFNWGDATPELIDQFEAKVKAYLQKCNTLPLTSTITARVGHVFLKHDNLEAADQMFRLLPDDPVGANSLGRGSIGLMRSAEGTAEFDAAIVDLLAARSRIALHSQRLELQLPPPRSDADWDDDADDVGHDHEVTAPIVGARTCLTTVCDSVSDLVGGPTRRRIHEAISNESSPQTDKLVDRVWSVMIQHCEPCTVRAVGRDTSHFVSAVLSAFPPLALQTRGVVGWLAARRGQRVVADDLPLATADRVWGMLLRCGVLTDHDRSKHTATIGNVAALGATKYPHSDTANDVMWPLRHHIQRLLFRHLAAGKSTISLFELDLPHRDIREEVFEKLRDAAVLTPWNIPRGCRSQLTAALTKELHVQEAPDCHEKDGLKDALLRVAFGTVNAVRCSLVPLSAVLRQKIKDCDDATTREVLRAGAEHVRDLQPLSLHMCLVVETSTTVWHNAKRVLLAVGSLLALLLSVASLVLGLEFEMVCALAACVLPEEHIQYVFVNTVVRVLVVTLLHHWRSAIDAPLRQMIRECLEQLTKKVSLQCSVTAIQNVTIEYSAALLSVLSTVSDSVKRTLSDVRHSVTKRSLEPRRTHRVVSHSLDHRTMYERIVARSLDPLQKEYTTIVAWARTSRSRSELPEVSKEDLEQAVSQLARRAIVALDVDLVRGDLYRAFVRSTTNALQENVRNVSHGLDATRVVGAAGPLAYPDAAVALRSFASVSQLSPIRPCLRPLPHSTFEVDERILKSECYSVFRVRTDAGAPKTFMAVLSEHVWRRPREHLVAAVAAFDASNRPGRLCIALPPGDEASKHVKEWCRDEQRETTVCPAWVAGCRSLAVSLAVHRGVTLVKEGGLVSEKTIVGASSVEHKLIGLPAIIAVVLRYATASSVDAFACAVAQVAIDIGTSGDLTAPSHATPRGVGWAREIHAWSRMCAQLRASTLSQQVAFTIFRLAVASFALPLRRKFEPLVQSVSDTFPCADWCLKM